VAGGRISVFSIALFRRRYDTVAIYRAYDHVQRHEGRGNIAQLPVTRSGIIADIQQFYSPLLKWL